MIDVIKAIFYTFWLFYAMNEIFVISNPMKVVAMARKFKLQKFKGKWSELDEEDKENLKKSLIFALPATIFRFIGIVTSNWLFFVTWIFFTLLTTLLTKEFLHRYINKIHILKMHVSLFSFVNVF